VLLHSLKPRPLPPKIPRLGIGGLTLVHPLFQGSLSRFAIEDPSWPTIMIDPELAIICRLGLAMRG
jgi:hypothetical protein